MVVTLKPLAIFCVTLLAGAAFAQQRNCPAATTVAHQEHNSIRINKVSFTGTPVLSSAEQQEISATLAQGAFKFKSLQDDGNALGSRTRMQWQQRGYFKVVVGTPELVPVAGDPSAFDATVRVEAGKQYRLAELQFAKNTVFPAERLRPLIALQPGEIFSTLNIATGIEAIRKLYADSGYIDMSLAPTTKIEKDSDQIDLTLELDEGPQFRVGKVEVLAGDEPTRRRFITSAGLLTGSIFNSSLLEEAFATESDGLSGMPEAVLRSIHESDNTVDLKVDLRPCTAVSMK